MPATTMATVDNILKEVYENQLRDQLQSEVTTIRRVEKTSEGVTHETGGKYVTFPLRVKRNHGIGARLENEALPAAKTQGYARANVGLTYQYGSIELTGQTFELAEKNFQAFSSALQQEMDGLKQTLAKDSNRQIYGTSKGVLATANAAGTTTTLVVSNAEAIYVEIGMFVDIYSSANALKDSAREITNVQRDTPAAGTTTITFTPAGTATASGDFFVRDDNLNKEIIGFRQIVANTGTLYGVDPTIHPVWKSEIDSPGAPRALSEGLMTNMCDRIRTNGGKTSVMFMSLGVRRSYNNLLVQQRRYNNTTNPTGGFTGLTFTTDWGGEIPMIADFDCPWNRIFFMNEKELKIYQAGDWSWMNRDGSNWQRVIGATGSSVGTYDAYQATMYKYFQLGTHRRNSHGLMENIIEG